MIQQRVLNGPPSPEEFQRQLQEFMRQHLAGGAMPKPEQTGTPETPPAGPPKEEFDFNKTPREVKAYLDRFVIKQEDAKKVLSVALCDHYHHVRMAREGRDTINYA